MRSRFHANRHIGPARVSTAEESRAIDQNARKRESLWRSTSRPGCLFVLPGGVVERESAYIGASTLYDGNRCCRPESWAVKLFIGAVWESLLIERGGYCWPAPRFLNSRCAVVLRGEHRGRRNVLLSSIEEFLRATVSVTVKSGALAHRCSFVMHLLCRWGFEMRLSSGRSTLLEDDSGKILIIVCELRVERLYFIR